MSCYCSGNAHEEDGADHVAGAQARMKVGSKGLVGGEFEQ